MRKMISILYKQRQKTDQWLFEGQGGEKIDYKQTQRNLGGWWKCSKTRFWWFGDCCTTGKMHQNYWIVHLKWVNLMLGKLYPNKAII